MLRRDNPLAQGDKQAFYARLLQPVVRAYEDLGAPVRYRPVNDIVTTAGRKISGTGVAEIADSVVLVGNIIADFDYDTMVRVLRVPDEKFRDKVFQSMRENLTTLRRETGREYSLAEMSEVLVRRFSEVLGPLEQADISPATRAEADALGARFLAEEWLLGKAKRRTHGRDVKIAEGVTVVQRVHKAPGGLLRCTAELRAGRLSQVSLSGDFFCYPQDSVEALEKMLEGSPLETAAEVIALFYTGRVETPGVTAADWLAVLGAPAA